MVCNKRGVENMENEDIVQDFDSDSDSDVSITDSDTSEVNADTTNDSNHEGDSLDEDIIPAEDDVVEEEDDVVKAIMAAREVNKTHPPDIQCDDLAVDICFHPENDFLAVATLLGDVQLYKYSNESNELFKTYELHVKSCRDIEFSHDGRILYSAAKDKSIVLADVESGKFIRNYDNAHEEPLYCLSVLDENLFASGDEDGTVNLWDKRMSGQEPVFSLKECEDYISDIVTNDAKKFLVCSSGDGSLATINMHSRKLHVQSEEYEEELTCLGLFRQEAKIVAGSSKGKLFTFNWNEFGLHCDCFPGPKQVISCMVPVTENIMISSGEDGVLRATHLFPQRHLGVVGQHQLSVEAIDISNNGEFVASSSHNNDVKFWNIKYFEDFEKMNHKTKQNKRKELKRNLPSSKYRDAGDFFSGLA